MTTLQARLNSLALFVSNWGWPAKFLLGAAVSSFAGGSLLGFLLQYAAYYFALSYGLRPPVEGVPYLVAMVTFGSIFLLLGAGIMAFSVAVLRHHFLPSFEWLAQKLTPFGETNLAQDFRSTSPLVVVAIVLSISALTIWVALHTSPSLSMTQELCAWPIMLCLSQSDLGFVPLTFYGIMIIFALMIWRPSLVWLGALSSAALLYISIAANILPPDGYARLLRMTGFGGGIQVEVELQPTDSSPKTTARANLLMRSNTTLFLYFPTEGLIREYPITGIRGLQHREGGLHALPVSLPALTKVMWR